MKTLDRIFPWLLLVPIVLPVVIWNGLIYPYLVPKTLLFYAISLASLATFLVLVTHGRSFYWSRLSRWETWVPAALLALTYSTSAIGIDFYRSFWSLFVRGDGLLMLSGVVMSFYFILLVADLLFFERLVRGVAVVGSFVAVYGIGEWLVSGGRTGSLLGNAAFFAGYLGITVFVTLLALQTLRGGWRRAAVGGAALQVVAIVLTATRGTILALLVASVAYLFYNVFAEKGEVRTWSARVLVALVLFSTLFVVFRADLAKVPFEPVARIASISTTDGDVASRLFVWTHMMTAIQKSPWIGVGAEHIDVLFNRFYDPSLVSEQWFDRSHNAFIDYWAQYGIGGLLSYLLLIISFCTTALHFLKRGERRTALLTALIAITYAVQNFFVFDTVSSLWLFIALLAVLIARARPELVHEKLPLPRWMRPTSWAVALALVAGIYVVAFLPMNAAYNLAHAYQYQLTDVSQEVGLLSHGFALHTYGDIEYGYLAYDMYANTQVTKLSGQMRVDAYQTALSILTSNFARYTYDARTAVYLAHILSLAPPSVAIDHELLSAALERALQLSPKRAQPWYILANLSISNGNQYPPQSAERIAGYAAAQDILNKYIAMVPTLSMPHYVLAQLLLASGDKNGADAEARRGKNFYSDDLETAMRAVGYYESVLDLPNAEFFLKEILRLDPTNASAKADLETIQNHATTK